MTSKTEAIIPLFKTKSSMFKISNQKIKSYIAPPISTILYASLSLKTLPLSPSGNMRVLLEHQSIPLTSKGKKYGKRLANRGFEKGLKKRESGRLASELLRVLRKVDYNDLETMKLYPSIISVLRYLMPFTCGKVLRSITTELVAYDL